MEVLIVLAFLLVLLFAVINIGMIVGKIGLTLLGVLFRLSPLILLMIVIFAMGGFQ